MLYILTSKSCDGSRLEEELISSINIKDLNDLLVWKKLKSFDWLPERIVESIR